ncbi:MAG: hypothetical protein QM770_05135 [Tepidisphaeraceae bacterium]
MLTCVASVVVFWLHVHRDTSRRAKVVLAEYADRLNMDRIDVDDHSLPPPLASVAGVKLVALAGFKDSSTHILRLRSDVPGQPSQEWNLLVRQVPTSSSPVGLRPTDAPRSVLDLYQMKPCPWQPVGQRFTIVGDDIIASAKIAEGSGRALLPPDLSLLRHGPTLVIDFSTRPFDEVSIDRVRALADQLASVV